MNRSASPKLQINRTRESHCACQCSSFGVCVCYVCGVHELSLLFRWILSVCLLFFAECLNKGKQIWHMCSTKKKERDWTRFRRRRRCETKRTVFNANKWTDLFFRAERKTNEAIFFPRGMKIMHMACVSLERWDKVIRSFYLQHHCCCSCYCHTDSFACDKKNFIVRDNLVYW